MSTLLVVDIGGTNVKLGFVVDGEPQPYVRLFSATQLHAADPVAKLASMISAMITGANLVPQRIVATVPGFLDQAAETVLFAANLPELNGCALASQLGRVTGIPVRLERDAILSLLGEYAAGACKGVPSVLGVFFGTGVGAAYLEHGRAFRGSGWALELGHMPYTGAHRWITEDRAACLEAYVSGKVLEHIADEHNVAIEEVFTGATQNAALGEHVDDFLRNQANAVISAIAILSPETVLIGGGICDMQGFPRQKLVTYMEANFPFHHLRRQLDVRWAKLGWQSVLHGASRMTRSDVK